MITAKLPPELRLDEPGLVSELRPGESGYVVFTDFTVSKDGDCFLTSRRSTSEKGQPKHGGGLARRCRVPRRDSGRHQ